MSRLLHCYICQQNVQLFMLVSFVPILGRNIKRIVFSTLIKYDGTNMVQLTSSQAKQIAGRAGRFGTDHPEGEAMT